VKLDNKVYDVVKAIAMIWLPGLGTLYAVVAGIWHLPAPEQVVGTITGVDAFLGGILKVSTVSYNASDDKYDGVLNVTTQPDGTVVHQLNVQTEPEDIPNQDAFLLKVQNNTAPATPAPPAPTNLTDPRLMRQQ